MTTEPAERGKKPTRDRRWCAYCGAPKTTDDHVPPKGVFGDLLKTDQTVQLVTVPSCEGCNLPESEDDEHFKAAMFVAAATSVGGFPDAVRDSLRRAVQNAERDGVRTPIQTFLREARETWGIVGGSSVVQRVQAVPVRWDRIRRTIERTARGLYWHHRGERVPAEFDVTIISDKEREDFGFMQADVFRETAQASLGGTRHVIHPEAFMYSIAFASDGLRQAVMTLCFYRKVLFLAVIGPPEAPTVLALP
jgi:hypothetical protein